MNGQREKEARSVQAAQCTQNEECRSAEIKINNNIKNNKSTLQRHNNKHSFRFYKGNCIERAICVRTRTEWMMHELKTKEMHCRRRLSETVHSVIFFYIYFVYSISSFSFYFRFDRKLFYRVELHARCDNKIKEMTEIKSNWKVATCPAGEKKSEIK